MLNTELHHGSPIQLSSNNKDKDEFLVLRKKMGHNFYVGNGRNCWPKNVEDKSKIGVVLSEIPLQFPVRHGQVQHQEDLFYLEPKLEDEVIVKQKTKEG